MTVVDLAVELIRLALRVIGVAEAREVIRAWEVARATADEAEKRKFG